jgi:hypothetical protein
MRRRPRADHEDERQRPYYGNGENFERVDTTRDVWESDEDTWTGLYDADGNKLYRERPRIGYRIR